MAQTKTVVVINTTLISQTSDIIADACSSILCIGVIRLIFMKRPFAPIITLK